MTKKKFNTANILNPKNEHQILEAIWQTSFVFIFMTLSKAFNVLLALFLGSQFEGDLLLPTIGSVTGTELGILLLIDVIILAVAFYFYKYKKSFIAACVILVMTILSFINLVDAYFLSAYMEPKAIKALIGVLYVASGILAVVATHRYKKLN